MFGESPWQLCLVDSVTSLAVSQILQQTISSIPSPDRCLKPIDHVSHIPKHSMSKQFTSSVLDHFAANPVELRDSFHKDARPILERKSPLMRGFDV